MDKYLLQRPSNHVYVWSKNLAKRDDMWPCDLQGNIIQPEAEQPAFVQVDFESMTKRQIEAYVLEHYQVDLDLRYSKADLVAEANKIVESMKS